MIVCMDVCMYVWMDVCMDVCMDVRTYLSMYKWRMSMKLKLGPLRQLRPANTAYMAIYPLKENCPAPQY